MREGERLKEAFNFLKSWWRSYYVSEYRKIIAAMANVLMVVFLIQVIVEVDSFKDYVDFQTYGRVVEAAKVCALHGLAVRADLCSVRPLEEVWSNRSLDVLNVHQADLSNLTSRPSVEIFPSERFIS